ncbi:MerR family DNA-binding transcriptional regulator [Actinacidiphila glaucinigra]
MTGAPPVSIQEVSRRSGLSEPTLRYYDKIGLIGRRTARAAGGA